jgi:hypothetical protein
MSTRIKEIEKYYFERFSRSYSLPVGEVEHDDAPDFIIKADQSIGLEITNFYLEDGNHLGSEQRQNPIRERVIETAQRIYKENDGRNIELSFGFNLIENENGLAQKIARFVSDLEYPKSGILPISIFAHIPELSFVYFNAQEYENPQWRLVQVHSTPMMNVERLLEIIKEKEEKSKKYKTCDSYWLLVVIDFINRAQDQEIANVVLPKIHSNVFNKILIYKTAYEQILEVFSSE